MALSPQQLQKKRAKKAAKRRETQTHRAPPASTNTRRQWLLGVDSPIHEVCLNDDVFDSGMGSLIFCRRSGDGFFIVAVFLLDAYCLGVKNVIQTVMTPDEYLMLKQGLTQSHGCALGRIEPAKGRRLLEELVAWSRNLGFEPHAEYRDAAKILGDIPHETHGKNFAFGRDGKPFYMSGPNETPARIEKIIAQLEKKCGKDGFDYMVGDIGF